MKKSILLILSNLESGGVTKSALSLLDSIDYSVCKVDLLLISNKGVHKDKVNKNVRVLNFSLTQSVFEPPSLKMFLLLLKAPHLFLLRLIQIIVSRIDRGYGGFLLSKAIPILNKKYDLAIDYHGQHLLCYLVDRVSAKIKVSFFHSDYSKWNYYFTTDKRYYSKVDKVFTISDLCVDSLKKWFPKEKDKIVLFENISSPSQIEKLADEKIVENFQGNTFLTIGHVCENKGASLAIESAKILKEKGLVFRWYFVGKVSQDVDYSMLIKGLGLEENVFFLGLKSNPYPFIKQARIIVHPSKFEGKSIALDEAKILAKPIVVTNFSTVKDQFLDGVNATICEMKPHSLSNAIIDLCFNKNLRERYSQNLKKNRIDNSEEVNKLYKLINLKLF